MGDVLKVLQEGGALGALAIALVVVAYLYRQLEVRNEKAHLELELVRKALDAEKDEHRKTAMSVVGLSLELTRVLDKVNERRPYGSRRSASGGGGAGGGASGGAGGSSTPGPTSGGGSEAASAEYIGASRGRG